MALFSGLLGQHLMDLIQGLGTVNARFPCAQQVQVWPIEYQQLCHDVGDSSAYPVLIYAG